MNCMAPYSHVFPITYPGTIHAIRIIGDEHIIISGITRM